MRPAKFLPRPELLLSSLTSMSLFGAVAFAQNDNTDSNSSSDTNSDTNSVTNGDSSTTSNPSEDSTTTAKKESTTKQTTTQKDETTTTEDASSSSSSSVASSTTAAKSSTTDISSSISSVASSTDSAITGMPTLTRVTTIPTYPAPTVPPTSNAPFMQHSSAPNGTIFIAVGAILGAFGIAILLWRVIVGFLLHRSVERAAKAQHDATTKVGFPAPPAPFYKYTDNGSNMSVAAGRGVRRTTRGPILSSTPSQSNLFFSPTAAASGNTAGNRSSAFLPSGFYAAGTSSPGANPDHSISLTNLRPDSRGYANPSRHTLNPSPPDSPSFNPRRDISNSSLNLNRPPSGRAPSAFLDDLLADDPSALPPPQMPSSRHSSYGNGSPGQQNRF